jgi:hypothetical protein
VPTVITEADTFDANVSVPNDGESVNQASLLLFAQGGANRARYLKNRVGHGCVATITGTAKANGVKFVFDSFFVNVGGYVLGDSNTTIQVPEAGLYLVSLSAIATLSDATNPSTYGASILPEGWEGQGTRFSASTGVGIGISITVQEEIATPASEKISLEAVCSAGNVALGLAVLSISRIGALTV